MAQNRKVASGHGALHFGGWHLLNSRPLQLAGLQLTGFRAFDLLRDPQELAPWNLRTLDWTLAQRTAGTLRAVQASGITAWKAFTRETEEATEIDPAAQEQLRALGYVQ